MRTPPPQKKEKSKKKSIFQDLALLTLLRKGGHDFKQPPNLKHNLDYIENSINIKVH